MNHRDSMWKLEKGLERFSVISSTEKVMHLICQQDISSTPKIPVELRGQIGVWLRNNLIHLC